MAEVRERFSSTSEERISREELVRVCDWHRLLFCWIKMQIPGFQACGLGWCSGVPRLWWYTDGKHWRGMDKAKLIHSPGETEIGKEASKLVSLIFVNLLQSDQYSRYP